MTWDTPRAKQPCITCGKNLAGHIRDIHSGKTKAHPFKTAKDKK
jgi:hypothetical protein